MNWNKGFSAQYYATFVDTITWRDTDKFQITGGAVKRTDSGLMQSADIDCINYSEKSEKWVRVYLDTSQEGNSAHVPIFTGLAINPQKNMNGTLVSNTLECYSVLKAADDVLLPVGYYVMAGTNGGAEIAKLLEATPAPVEVEENSPRLSQTIVAEDGETNLSMAQKVLAAINWRFKINGDGTILVCSPTTQISATFDPLNNDSIKPQIKLANDWFSCPNVFRAISGDTSATARDDSEDSPLSTVNRGREVWAQEKDIVLNQNETLAEYASRRLKELQQHYISVSYERRFHPDVQPTDAINLHYPGQGLDGIYYVTSQTIDIGHGAETSEEVIEI